MTFAGSLSGGVFWAAIFFLTANHYGFSPEHNLVLAAAMGAVYASGAATAGRLVRQLAASSSPRALLMAGLACWTIAGLAPLLAPHAEVVLWGAALLGAASSAVTWPIVESYLGAGRHGADMRAAIGWFNVTWTPATALALLLMPAVSRVTALGTLALSAAASAVALAAAFAFPVRPGAHATEVADAAVGREYHPLLRSVSWLLPTSYVLCSVMAPLLPHRLAEVGGSTTGGVVPALWMIARFFTLIVMWRSGFWHGRWGTLVLAACALAAGLATILLAPTVTVVAAGLVIFGVGMGLTYYAALYYSLAVGHAEVDAGRHVRGVDRRWLLRGTAARYRRRRRGARAPRPRDRHARLAGGRRWLTGAIRPYLAARRARISAATSRKPS